MTFHIITSVVLSLLGAIGLTFSVWGFRCWYHRVQIHKDQALASKPALLATSGGVEPLPN